MIQKYKICIEFGSLINRMQHVVAKQQDSVAMLQGYHHPAPGHPHPPQRAEDGVLRTEPDVDGNASQG